MATIRVDMTIAAPPARVWEIVSDLDSEPKFWKGTKSVRNISEDNGVVKREIVIAFRDQKCMQEVRLFPGDRIEFSFTAGIIDGQKIIYVRPHDDNAGGSPSTVLSTVWDIKMAGMMGLFTGMLKGHIRNGTDMAMKSIKEHAERGGQ